MPVESSARLHTSSPLRCLDIITITAHSTEVLHSCDAVMAVFHIVIIPESILKGPTWKTVEGWASPRWSQVVQGWNKSLACFIFIAACLLNSSFGHPLKGTGCAIDCSHSLRDYLCLYGTALIARRTTLFFVFLRTESRVRYMWPNTVTHSVTAHWCRQSSWPFPQISLPGQWRWALSEVKVVTDGWVLYLKHQHTC